MAGKAGRAGCLGVVVVVDGGGVLLLMMLLLLWLREWDVDKALGLNRGLDEVPRSGTVCTGTVIR